jgi:predicted secreted protein
MASFVGNAGAITIGGQTVAEVRSYSIELTADTIEQTTMGDATRQYVKGLSSFSGSADVYWDPAHWTAGGLNPTVGSVGAAPVELKVFPEGATVGTTDKVMTGNIIITGYTVNGSFDGMVEASISFQGTGALSYAVNG